MFSQESDCFGRCAPARRRKRVQTSLRQFGPQHRFDRRRIVDSELWRSLDGEPGQSGDDPGKLGLRISVECISGPFSRRLLGFLAPRIQPRWSGAIQKQCASEQFVDGCINFWPQGADDPPQPFSLAALFF